MSLSTAFGITLFPPFNFGTSAVVIPPYFERDLLAYLSTFGVKVCPGHIPQKAILPAVSFALIHEAHLKTLVGSAGQCIARYQISVASTRYTDVGTISEQIRKSFERVQFSMGQTFVGSALCDEGRTRYAAPLTSSDRGVHEKIREYVFQYNESIPTF